MDTMVPRLGWRNGLRRLFRREEWLSWREVQDWIAENLPKDWAASVTSFPSAERCAFVELRRAARQDSIVLTATYVIGDGQAQPVLSKTWQVHRLDAELMDVFGKELQVRIEI